MANFEDDVVKVEKPGSELPPNDVEVTHMNKDVRTPSLPKISSSAAGSNPFTVLESRPSSKPESEAASAVKVFLTSIFGSGWRIHHYLWLHLIFVTQYYYTRVLGLNRISYLN